MKHLMCRVHKLMAGGYEVEWENGSVRVATVEEIADAVIERVNAHIPVDTTETP